MIPNSTFAAALTDLGATGRAIIAMRQRCIAAPLAAYDAAIAPTASARALAASVASIGRATTNVIRKVQP